LVGRLSLQLMRSVLFLSFIFSLPLVITAQVPDNQGPVDILPDNVASQSASAFSAWYNYAKLIDQVAEEKEYFGYPLFPDSTVWVEFDNGYDKVSKHSLGQVIDPCAPLFETSNMKLDSNMTYSLDSIGIYYKYFRPVDSVPDLIVVQLYRGDKVSLVEDPNWSSKCSYASLAYDPVLRRGGRADKEFSYFLENSDTTKINEKGILKFPVEWDMEKGEKAAVVVTYFPINPYQTGDTLDPFSSIPLKRKINSFFMYEIRDSDPNIETGYYNNGLVATRDVRYDASWTFWRKKYKPGTLWASSVGIFHSDISFLISTDGPIGLEETVDAEEDRLKIVSVANNIELSNAPLNFENISLHDLSGRRIPIEVRPETNQVTITSNSSYKGIAILRLDNKSYKLSLGL